MQKKVKNTMFIESSVRFPDVGDSKPDRSIVIVVSPEKGETFKDAFLRQLQYSFQVQNIWKETK